MPLEIIISESSLDRDNTLIELGAIETLSFFSFLSSPKLYYVPENVVPSRPNLHKPTLTLADRFLHGFDQLLPVTPSTQALLRTSSTADYYMLHLTSSNLAPPQTFKSAVNIHKITEQLRCTGRSGSLSRTLCKIATCFLS